MQFNITNNNWSCRFYCVNSLYHTALYFIQQFSGHTINFGYVQPSLNLSLNEMTQFLSLEITITSGLTTTGLRNLNPYIMIEITVCG